MGKEAKKKNEKKVVPVSSTSDSESEDDESESVQESNDSDDYSEEESDYNDYSYGVEYARSGRALCRTCDSLIPNRSLRWVVSFKADVSTVRPSLERRNVS
ncbi:uncharacterized protein LOC113680267 [Pocillopora damicornis]|uniref:uncharacterized protein LOC113680267 n=1 Tax=Pocillopora damicornis TaxID=46731 RepID=UPI000F550AAB|nr:uncharacterized protein LOC113680267 [Pocillopora damicornis]